MARFGFVGPSYVSESVNADCQVCRNFYVENMEDPSAKVPRTLYYSPGTKLFCTLPESPVRGEIEINGRMFAIGGSKFCEILSDGTVTTRGTIISDGHPASLAASNTQVMIASGGQGYCFTLATNTLSAAVATLVGVAQVYYSDGYFLARIANSAQVFVSNLLDGTTWDPAQTAIVSVFAGFVTSMIVDHREMILLGNKQSQAYYDSGNTFPYDVVPGGFIEDGCAAGFATAKLDNTYFWITLNERGQGRAVKASAGGYTPSKISTHAIEQEWASYVTISDAEGYAFEINGHQFWHIFFPTANKSWRYDVATGLWHEVSYRDPVSGKDWAHRSRCHIFAFGKHLVGDWNSGKIYELSKAYYDDDGDPIIRVRVAPHVSTEQQRIAVSMLQVDLEVGDGPMPPLTGGPASGVPFLCLEDSSGAFWWLQITDGGLIEITPVSSGTPGITYLRDANGGWWQIGVTTGGEEVTTPVSSPPPESYESPLPFVTVGGLQTYLRVGTDGILSADDPATVSRGPYAMLEISRNGGHSYGNILTRDCGQQGEFKKRVIWNRLGTARDFVFKLTVSDPVPWRILDAYLEASPGFNIPTERLSKQYAKVG